MLEEATVSLTVVDNFMIDGGFLMGIENCSISGGRIWMDETFKKELIEEDRNPPSPPDPNKKRKNKSSLGDKEDVHMTREDYLCLE